MATNLEILKKKVEARGKLIEKIAPLHGIELLDAMIEHYEAEVVLLSPNEFGKYPLDQAQCEESIKVLTKLKDDKRKRLAVAQTNNGVVTAAAYKRSL